MPGCIPFDRSTDSEPLGQLLAQAHERGLPFSGVVWRAPGRNRKSSADIAARIETEITNLLSVVHTVQASKRRRETARRTVDRHRTAVATESGEPVDPVQAALWGFGRTTINEEPALHSKLVDFDGSPEAVQALANLLATPVDEPEIALRQGKLLASRLLPWARSGNLAVPRGATTSWRPPNAVRSTTCG